MKKILIINKCGNRNTAFYCIVNDAEQNLNSKTILQRKWEYSNKILVILDLHICKHITSLANFTIRIILCSPGWVFVDNSYFIFYNSIKVHDIPVRITSENIGKMRDYNGIFINKPYW